LGRKISAFHRLEFGLSFLNQDQCFEKRWSWFLKTSLFSTVISTRARTFLIRPGVKFIEKAFIKKEGIMYELVQNKFAFLIIFPIIQVLDQHSWDFIS